MHRFQSILFYVGNGHDVSALTRAVTLAHENRAKLTLIDVIKPLPRSLGSMTDVTKPKELEELLRVERRQRLFGLMVDYSDLDVPFDTVVKVGDPATEIVREVLSGDHDLVMKTADGYSTSERMFGSVASSLLRLCPCPLWILKPEIHGPFDQVLAAIDVDDNDEVHCDLNHEILELAFSISQRENAQLHVVSAWDLWMEGPLRRRAGDAEVDAILSRQESRVRRLLDDLLQAPLAEKESIRIHLSRGPASQIIRSVADQVEADLLVMGSVCRTGIAGFLIGNTAEEVLSQATCSVLTLKPDGFVTPVEMADEEYFAGGTEDPLPLM